MGNMKRQPAQATDGTPKGMPPGQTSKIERMNNPVGMSNLKNQRNTGKMAQGTAFLRANKSGVK